VPTLIALVTRLDQAEEDAWLAALTAAMPNEVVVPFRTLDPSQRRDVEIAIVANPDPADVAGLPNLALIQSLWAGVEGLVSELGPNAPPIVRMVDPEMARTMSEAVLAWTYYIQRDMPAYARQQREKAWRQLPYRKPSDMTVGLLGLGALGAASAQRLAVAGFWVVGWSRSPKEWPDVKAFSGEEGLAAVLSMSDVVVCLIPLTSETRGLLNTRRLAMAKPGAALINFARGPIVVVPDLLAALDSGRLSHAVLDVFDEEPLPAASPFWAHPDVTVLPHISAPTDLQIAARVVADNVGRFRRGERITGMIDTSRGY
jgi:glyoxylate/hydroxypyruvate reductase A